MNMRPLHVIFTILGLATDEITDKVISKHILCTNVLTKNSKTGDKCNSRKLPS